MTRFLCPGAVRSLVVAAAALLPWNASAIGLGAVLNTTGTNTLSVQLQIQCSGGFICSFIGLGGSGYNQTQTSTVSGSTGLYVDDFTDSIQLSSDAGGTTNLMTLTGTNITFTGLNSTLTGNGGSTVTVSNLVASAVNAGLGSVLGYDLFSPPQSIAFGLSGAGALQVGATGTTNSPNIPTISLAPTAVNTLGTFNYLGDPDLDLYPNFSLQNLRGAFASLTSTATFGSTLHITLRATFTLNFVGESLTAIPEPASLGLVGLGVAGFALAARRRS